MWDAISAVMNSFNDFLWGWFMIILLLGTHIFLTIRTKFVQIISENGIESKPGAAEFLV